MQITTGANKRAYVLIEAETDHIGEALMALRDLPTVVEADAVAGTCDIIAKIATAEERAIGALVIETIHAIPGIKRTTTCVTIQ